MRLSNPSLVAIPPPQPLLFPALAWLPILILIAISGLCMLARLGTILNLLFPAGAFLIAVHLHWRYPAVYVGFVWWLWFVSPMVRRLADYFGSGWTDPSPILLAPLLSTLVCGLSLATSLRKQPAISLPFLICGMSVVYGFFTGLFNNTIEDEFLNLMGWLAPICLGHFLVYQWRLFPLYRRLLQRVFFWGVFFIGAYGLIQFLVAPPWDQNWMIAVDKFYDLDSIGLPEPLKIRVFSTAMVPQMAGAFLMAGLLLLCVSPKQFKNFPILYFLTMIMGTLSFLLTAARSAWLTLALGLAVLLPSLKSRFQIRLFASLLVLLIGIIPASHFDTFSSVIVPRIQGLTNPSDDTSLKDRSGGYERLLGLAFSQVSGNGLGFEFEDQSLAVNDSGLLTLWFSLGWLGAIPYLSGIGFLILKLMYSHTNQIDPFVTVSRAVTIGTLPQILLNVVTIGPIAIVLWTFLGAGVAGVLYYKSFGPASRSG